MYRCLKFKYMYSQNPLRGYVFIRYPVTLLINLKQCIHNKWLLNSLQDLEISLVPKHFLRFLVNERNILHSCFSTVKSWLEVVIYL